MQDQPEKDTTRREFMKTVGAATAGAGLVALSGNEASAAQKDDLTTLSATELSQLIARKEVSAEEVAEAHLSRIARVNPKLNAIVQIDEDRVRAEARAADRLLRKKGPTGPLHGVPFTMKDQLLTKGMVTTNGCPELKSYVPKEDATVVRRLKEAGGILLGKTNVPEMCHHGITDNIVYGQTNNPYDLTRSPDGSSGGEAAIIAAGGSPVGIGTDIGGSIRSPSHVCGIAGIKPTSRRVPETGMLGAFPPSVAHWNGIGPMARYVEDLALVLKIISGPDGKDPHTVPAPLGDSGDVVVEELRVAYCLADGVSQPTIEVKFAVKAAAKQLKAAGIKVVEDCPTSVEEAMDIWLGLLIPSWAIATRHWQQKYARMGGSKVSEERLFLTEWMLKWLDFLYQTGKYTPKNHLMLELALERYHEHMLAFVRRYDVLLSPVVNKPAVPHPTPDDMEKTPFADFWDVVKQDVGAFCMAHNLTGWPAVVVRAGTSPEGLPIGVQIAAKPWREDVALAVAGVIEKRLGGWQAPPKL